MTFEEWKKKYGCDLPPSWDDLRAAWNCANAEYEKNTQEIARLREAANVALGHLTGGMDGDWRDCDPIELLREALNS